MFSCYKLSVLCPLLAALLSLRSFDAFCCWLQSLPIPILLHSPASHPRALVGVPIPSHFISPHLNYLPMPSDAMSSVLGVVGMESHMLSLTPQQLFSALSSVLLSPSASVGPSITSHRSRKRRRAPHPAPSISGLHGALESDAGVGSGDDDELHAAVAAMDDSAPPPVTVLPVSAEWLRVACNCCAQLCAAQQQRWRQRRRKQEQQQQQQQQLLQHRAPPAQSDQAAHQLASAEESCTGSPCVSYLCSLQLLIGTHCVSLTACPALLQLTLQCYTSHPQLLRALLTATHDWSEAQIVQALRHVLHAGNVDTRSDETIEEAEGSTDQTLSDHHSPPDNQQREHTALLLTLSSRPPASRLPRLPVW